MFIKFFVSVSVIFSIQTDAIFFELFSRFFWVISFKAKRCPVRPTKTRFSGCPRYHTDRPRYYSTEYLVLASSTSTRVLVEVKGVIKAAYYR